MVPGGPGLPHPLILKIKKISPPLNHQYKYLFDMNFVIEIIMLAMEGALLNISL